MNIEVTRDELDKKVEEIRERRKRGEPENDRTALTSGDPNMRYRWANTKPENVQRRKSQGYKITDPKKAKARTGYEQDGAICLGEDLVLMELPRDKYVERLARQRLRDEAREKSVVEAARENINRIYRDEARGKPHKDIFVEDKPE